MAVSRFGMAARTAVHHALFFLVLFCYLSSPLIPQTKAQDIYLAGYSRVLTEPNAFGYGPDPATTTKTNIRKHTMTPADPDYNEEESIYDTRPHKWIFPQVPKPHNEPLLRPKKAKKEGEETMDPAALNAAYRAGYSATRPCPGDWIRDEATGHCYPPDANAATDSTGATAADWSLLALWAAIIASAIYASSILLRSPQNQPAGLPPTPYPGYRRPSSEPEDPPSLPNRFLQWLWALICGLLLSPFRFVGFSIRVARDTALAVIDAIRAWFHPYVEVARYHPLRDSLARFTWRFRRALVGWKLWSVIMGLAYVLLLLDQRKGAKHVVAVRRSATTSGTWHYWPGSALNRKWDGSNSHYDKSKWERDDSSLDALGRVERIVGGSSDQEDRETVVETVFVTVPAGTVTETVTADRITVAVTEEAERTVTVTVEAPSPVTVTKEVRRESGIVGGEAPRERVKTSVEGMVYCAQCRQMHCCEICS